MIEKFAGALGGAKREFLDLNHAGNFITLVSLLIPKFARGPSIKGGRTSESDY